MRRWIPGFRATPLMVLSSRFVCDRSPGDITKDLAGSLSKANYAASGLLVFNTSSHYDS
jgi:hypothetical protein